MNEQLTDSLDTKQAEAVLDSSGHLLIVAPPGSGKTRVLAARFRRLVAEAGPGGVLAVTFTNRAAREMACRVESLFGRGAGPSAGLNITTFHAFCLAFLRERLGAFTLYGRAEQVALLRELGVKGPVNAADRISYLKNVGCEADDESRGLREIYNEGLRSAGALDLDDLALESIRLLEGEGPEGGLFAHVLVDEYQDINPPQARLARLLAGTGGKVSAIGDPDQAIYAFRGSDPGCFAGFVRDYPGARTVELTRCYRSGARIVEAASAVMGAGPVRPARGFNPVRPGGVVTVVSSPDARAEAGYIVGEIERLMGGLSSLTVESGETGRAGARELRFSDFAVLARTNATAESMAGEFARFSVPFQLVGPQAAGVTSFIKRLRGAVVGEGVEVKGFVEQEAVSLGEEARRVVLDAAASETGAGPGGLASFIERLAVAEPEDRFDITADRVSIMTMHMTKGLEFDTVFITGAEDGLIPLRTASGRFDVEEERRLFYVAMTRARERLYVTTARRRRLWGEVSDRGPSPFLADVPEALIGRVDLSGKTRRRRPVQGGLFD